MKKHLEAMKKAGLSLAFFAFLSVLLVAVTDQLTKDKIIQNKKIQLLSALNQIIPKSDYDNDLIASKMVLSAKDSGMPRDTPIYIASKNGQFVTAIFEVTTLKGYSGAIVLLVGVHAKSAATNQRYSLSGVRVIQHTETPGLGDRMESRKTNWVLSFNGKYIGKPELSGWYVKKDGGDFDQFTGATITPRAIVNAVRTTLLYAQDNLDSLLIKPLKSTTTIQATTHVTTQTTTQPSTTQNSTANTKAAP